MVMRKNAMRRNLRQSILRSLGRYIAIAAIIALGSGLFLGLLFTKSDMVATGQFFTDQQNMFDLRILGSYGWTEEYVEQFAQMTGIADAEGVVSVDLLARMEPAEEDSVYRFISIPEKINCVVLKGGRMPEKADECLADGYRNNDQILGAELVISDANEEDSLESVKFRKFTVVGYVSSPLYMDTNRGTTSVGNGSLTNYFYIPADSFDTDYYTEIDLTIEGNFEIYTDTYNDALDAAADAIKPEAEALNLCRYNDVKNDAEDAYAEGYQEYLDGVKEYEDGKAEAEQELADAKQELEDGEKELAEGRIKLINAGAQIEEGRKQLKESYEQLKKGRAELAAQKAQASVAIPAAKANLDSQRDAIKSSYDQSVSGKGALEGQISALNQQIQALDPEAEDYESSKAALSGQVETASNQLSQINQVIAAWDSIQAGYRALEAQEQQLKQAEQQLADGEAKYRAADHELDRAVGTLESNWRRWHEAEEELADGWEEYKQAKADAEKELEDARLELEDARIELEDARRDIDDMSEPDLYILDRNTNVGYANLDSSSDIVSGVSRVFPAFFLLIASLVCITTMSRMIEEERVQIGTLKALGYSNRDIISKYLIYSGSSSILGCGVGILAGITVFPTIIWQAYGIIFYIQKDIVLTFNWPLALAVIMVYTAVMLFVTWYCCHKALEEEPACLIRPKAPDAGKKILLEYLPIWPKISFLNKVTIRNIFRYRQRMAMMLVGIGGCTALLLTGFGLRDSIVNIMNYQFDHVMHYDMAVYFRKENSPRENKQLLESLDGEAEEMLFCHQSSLEIAFGDRVKQIYLISAGQQLEDFIQLQSGEKKIDMPGINQAVLSVGVAQSMGIHQGDRITLRNGEMETLDLVVSGIYDNHVYNYAIVLPETIEAQWGYLPEKQIAFVKTVEGADCFALSARVSDLENVTNVSVSEDLAAMVRGMMDALDLVVWLIIFCAGLLAFTVQYNLTNININERLREIATIKVLGFNAVETSAYVFKENLALTVAGTVLGLLMGKLLLIFVMSQIKIDMVWFKAIAEARSYILAVVLTILSAIIVNLVFFRKLERINMAEALKSVE